MHYKSDEIDILDLKNIHLSNSIINKYLSFNKTTLEKINISKKELFKNKKNILGVKVRRSDYLLKPHLHCVVPEIDDILSKVKIFLKEWNMEYVYLSTEELQIVELFRDIFKEKLIVTNCPRIDKYNLVEGKCSSALKFNRANDNYLRGLEYIIDTVLLSYCDALIAPKVNGSIVALEYNNNRYKYKYIYDLGKY
jgi:hypothetical protein